MSVLDEEQRTFERERQRLLAIGEGKFVLIKGNHIVDVFDSEDIAIAEGFARLDHTPFYVKEITKTDVPLNFTSDIFGR